MCQALDWGLGTELRTIETYSCPGGTYGLGAGSEMDRMNKRGHVARCSRERVFSQSDLLDQVALRPEPRDENELVSLCRDGAGRSCGEGSKPGLMGA